MQYAEPITRLIKSLARLPGIGEKSASRLAMFILNSRAGYAEELSSAILGVKNNVKLCSVCMGFSETDPCAICSDPARDPSTVCVVGDYKDMIALEASNNGGPLGGGTGGGQAGGPATGPAGPYTGRYHILHGLLAPLKGIGPDDIRLKELIARVKTKGVREVIVATAFDGEGEATAHYISRALNTDGNGESGRVKLTRIASGVPAGGSIEYMDPTTLFRAMNGRKEL